MKRSRSFLYSSTNLAAFDEFDSNQKALVAGEELSEKTQADCVLRWIKFFQVGRER